MVIFVAINIFSKGIDAQMATQYELIQLLANRFNRHDLVITPKMRIRAGSILKSAYEDEHEYLWSLLGFKKVPSIRELI